MIIAVVIVLAMLVVCLFFKAADKQNDVSDTVSERAFVRNGAAEIGNPTPEHLQRMFNRS